MDESLRSLVRRVVGRVLAERGTSLSERRSGVFVRVENGADPTARPSDAASAAETDSGAAGGGRALVTADCLASVPDGGSFDVPAGALITPLAQDEAARRRIRLAAGGSRPANAGATGRLRVAIGCDHGGFALKQDVVAWVRELGHEALDFGTHDENPVDYPDFARKVAEAVAAGRCELGVCVDGAGIGSAMAANKVPGVRAANAWDVAGAQNAREHNYANVLTLGGRSLARDRAFDVLRAFLSTPEGPERHARRVAKITAIERQYARNQAAETSF